MDEEQSKKITGKIIGGAFKVSNSLGSGFLEKVYENALFIELTKSGLAVKHQFPIAVYYGDDIVGEYFADLFVEDKVIVELKTVSVLDDIHMAQCLNYLKATGLELCLLMNFHRPRVEIKRIISTAKISKVLS